MSRIRWVVVCGLAAAASMSATARQRDNVYGEHQNLGNRYRNVIGIFMNQIMHGQPLTVFGDGTQTRECSYIDDVAPQQQST